MNTIASLWLSLSMLLLGAPAFGAEAASTWEVEGVMSDACQCTVFCPCEFAEKPTLGHCDDAAILHIDKGHYGDLKLNGMRVAVVSQSPHGERLVDSVGRLNFAHIYVPKDSSDAQAKALAEIVRLTMGTFVGGVARISPNETIERVPMQVTIEPARHRIQIPGILELDIEALLGGDGKTPIVLGNHPFSAFGFSERVIIAHSTKYTYKKPGIDWNYAGRSASIRTFKLSGEITPATQAALAAGINE